MDAGQGALIGRFEPKVLSLFVGQKLGTFIASVKTDLKVLAELIEVGKVIPVIDRTGDYRNHLVSPPGSGNNIVGLRHYSPHESASLGASYRGARHAARPG